MESLGLVSMMIAPSEGVAKGVICRGDSVVLPALLDMRLRRFKAGDGLAGGRVAPFRLAALPAGVGTQDLAVSL